VVVILSIEFVQAVPAKLVLALRARHKLAATCADDHYVAVRALFRAKRLIQAREDG
jgi:hypothetical protein